MRELRMTDLELQRLVGDALRKRLAKAGFKTGLANDENDSMFLPIRLNLAGDTKVVRHEDGTWSFSQEDSTIIADRMAETYIVHAAAVAARENPRCR